MKVFYLSNAFFASIEIICGFCPLLIMVYYTDFRMLNQPCIPGINPIWSWYIILFLCCWIQFPSILSRIFAFIFITVTIFPPNISTDLSNTYQYYFLHTHTWQRNNIKSVSPIPLPWRTPPAAFWSSPAASDWLLPWDPPHPSSAWICCSLDPWHGLWPPTEKGTWKVMSLCTWMSEENLYSFLQSVDELTGSRILYLKSSFRILRTLLRVFSLQECCFFV